MKEGNAPSLTAFLVLLAAIVPSLVLSSSALHTSQPSAVHTLDDAAIFGIFDEVNAADIWMARLGAKKCHAQEVCELARIVASDHEQVQQMMRDLARKLAITPVPPDSDSNAQDHAKAIALLQDKYGDEFDRAYLLHEIAFHSAAVNAVKQTLLPTIQNGEFKALVRKVLPGLEQHLAETAEVAHKLGYK
jgi:putative membrane protein